MTEFFSVLFVGSDSSTKALLRETLRHQQFRVTEVSSTYEALVAVRQRSFDLILAEVCAPVTSWLQLLSSSRDIDPSIAFVVLAQGDNAGEGIEVLRRGADDYLPIPFEPDVLRHTVQRSIRCRQLARENRQLKARAAAIDEAAQGSRESERMTLDALLAIANAIELRDGYNGRHVERVTKAAVITGRMLGLDAATLRNVQAAALLHDLGKIVVPDRILRKATALTPEEDALVRQNPLVGAEIVARSQFLRPAAPAILHQHERWDGGGYPHGLAGEEIPIESRILGVSEAFDAMVAQRPYRGRLSRTEAVSELYRCAAFQFDANVVEAFIESLGASVTEPVADLVF